MINAGTDVGIGNAIETQVSNIEAASVGVAFSNAGNLQVGRPSGNLHGILTDTSGDVVLTNQGSIVLTDTALESLRAAGNLTMFATGTAADITCTVDRDVLVSIGNMLLVAERDVSFGTGGTNFDNDVRAGGGITIIAGRDFNIDGFADLVADDQNPDSGGGVNITAGRNINIDDNTGVDASIGVNSWATGSVVLTTGAGGTMTLAASSSSAVFAGIGGVFLNADRLLIEADSGVWASAGGAVTIAAVSSGRAINLGSSADDVAALELSDAELDRILANSVIVGSDMSGDVNVLGDLSTTFANFEIRSGRDIMVLSGISATNLTMRADGDVLQSFGSAITAGLLNIFVDQDGAADAVGGVTSGAANLTGNASVNTLDGGAGDDKMNGRAGNDILIGGLGADALDGGTDFDIAGYGSATSGLTARLDDATLNTGEAAGDIYTSIKGLDGTAFKDTLIGDAGSNGLRGAGGNDRLRGLDVDDAIQGNAGKDKLSGDIGADTLNGGLEADRLMGGAYADTFVFSSIADSGIKAKLRDTIVDFKRSEGDKFDLQGIDAIASTGGDDAFTFIGKTGFHGVEGELRYQKKNGDTFISGDVDGDGKADFSILVDAGVSMKVTDFNL